MFQHVAYASLAGVVSFFWGGGIIWMKNYFKQNMEQH
jgi:hypothetical protein